jgi:hypothetical protein
LKKQPQQQPLQAETTDFQSGCFTVGFSEVHCSTNCLPEKGRRKTPINRTMQGIRNPAIGFLLAAVVVAATQSQNLKGTLQQSESGVLCWEKP